MSNDVIKQLLPVSVKVPSDPEFKGVVSSKEQLRAFLVPVTLTNNKTCINFEILVTRPRATPDVFFDHVPRPAVVRAIVRDGFAVADGAAILSADVNQPVTLEGVCVDETEAHHVWLGREIEPSV